MKTRKLYSAPVMKVVAVETEQMIAESLGGSNYAPENGAKVNVLSGETDDEAGAKRSTSLWDEDE